jgi:hypothetical protein
MRCTAGAQCSMDHKRGCRVCQRAPQDLLPLVCGRYFAVISEAGR